MCGVVFKKGKWETYCVRVIEERLLWSYYMIFDSCQTINECDNVRYIVGGQRK